MNATDMMSRHSHAMLLNILWHHQGASSNVGQPIRQMLGIGQYDRMTDEQVAAARWIDSLLARPSVPDGWQLVPKEPTPAMLDSAVAYALNVQIHGEYGWTPYMRDLWNCMLAAAPEAAK